MILVIVVVVAAIGITVGLFAASHLTGMHSSNSPLSPVINKDKSQSDPFASLAKKIEQSPVIPKKQSQSDSGY